MNPTKLDSNAEPASPAPTTAGPLEQLDGNPRCGPPEVPAAGSIRVPFFRVELQDQEVQSVVEVLRSGWLTSGRYVKEFETEFAAFVGAKHAIAVNSCTAALHLAVAALELTPNQAVLVPVHTFAATAEIVRYMGATPILVDVEPETLNIDLQDAEQKIRDLRAGKLPHAISPDLRPAGIIPVHVGGHMVDMDSVKRFAEAHGIWAVEDAAHALPAAYRLHNDAPWRSCGEATADVSCFSFYANKTITTGEGGMAVTASQSLAERMKMLSLHGLSRDAWQRFSARGDWDYRIMAPGFKYNLTDVAAALGLRQLERAQALRDRREQIALRYVDAFADVEQIDLPSRPPDRLHAWHLFPIRLRLDQLSIDRNAFIERLRENGVGVSVHWRPLHLHPYYADAYHWRPEHFPVATREWARLISLPLFPTIQERELDHVIDSVRRVCREYTR